MSFVKSYDEVWLYPRLERRTESRSSGDALKREGCDRIYTEKLSGASKHRPEYEKMLEQVRPGDEVVVWDIRAFL